MGADRRACGAAEPRGDGTYTNVLADETELDYSAALDGSESSP
jgi:hypothetical protein